MRCFHPAGFFVTAVSLAVLAFPSLASDPDPSRDALIFMGKAIQAEIEGDLLGRDRMLKEAAQADTTFAPARWLQGQLLTSNGIWTTIEENIDQARSNKLLTDYEAMRAMQPPSVLGNWQAAQWCANNGLAAQCRAHLENILVLDHDNSAARAALGHQLLGNEWLSPTDQANLVRRADFVRQGNAKYGKRIEGLVSKLRSGSNHEQQRVLKEITAIEDPLAIPVIENTAELETPIALLAIKLLEAFEHPESAKSLMRIAVLCPDARVSEAAIEALKKKQFHDFVPEMLAAMSSQILSISVTVYHANGQFAGFRQSFAKEGEKEYRLLNFDTRLATTTVPMPVATQDSRVTTVDNQTMIAYQPYHPGHDLKTYLNQTTTVSYAKSNPAEVQAAFEDAYVMQQMVKLAAVASVVDRQIKVDRENQQIALLNTRIASVLSSIAEVEFPQVPQDVWHWWDNFNETSYQRSKYTRQQYAVNTFTAPELQAYQNQYINPVSSNKGFSVTQRCCLVAGTQINTLRGLQPIETILPGDMALTRNIQTGELTYKPVICGTKRDAAKTVKLTVDDETIQATTSHLLWVCGRGWVKAGDLKIGDLLHTAAEPAVIVSSTPGPELPTYNLVIADNHTYFVGACRVLSHDVLPRSSTVEQVPGQTLFSVK